MCFDVGHRAGGCRFGLLVKHVERALLSSGVDGHSERTDAMMTLLIVVSHAVSKVIAYYVVGKLLVHVNIDVVVIGCGRVERCHEDGFLAVF